MAAKPGMVAHVGRNGRGGGLVLCMSGKTDEVGQRLDCSAVVSRERGVDGVLVQLGDDIASNS
jgi:hypothetical protein